MLKLQILCSSFFTTTSTIDLGSNCDCISLRWRYQSRVKSSVGSGTNHAEPIRALSSAGKCRKHVICSKDKSLALDLEGDELALTPVRIHALPCLRHRHQIEADMVLICPAHPDYFWIYTLFLHRLRFSPLASLDTSSEALVTVRLMRSVTTGRISAGFPSWIEKTSVDAGLARRGEFPVKARTMA